MAEPVEWRPRIASVRSGKGRVVTVAWDDGNTHVIDLSAFLGAFEVYRPLDDDAAFHAVEVGEFGLSLRWPGEVEMAATALRRLALEQDAERFRSWRKARGLSQEAAGAALGIRRRMIQYYEGQAYPVPKTVRLAMNAVDHGLSEFSDASPP